MESDLASRKLELALKKTGVLRGNGGLDDRNEARSGGKSVLVGLGKGFSGSNLDIDIISVKFFGANKKFLLHCIGLEGEVSEF